jgi:SNF2 family DNA or RNA helicase
MDLIVFPNGGLHLEGVENLKASETLLKAFARGTGFGLLDLDSWDSHEAESESLSYWKDFVRIYLALFASTPELENRDLSKQPIQIPFPDEELNRFIITAPPVKGSEYINGDHLKTIWLQIEESLRTEIKESGKSISDYFSDRHSKWNLLGRVCFHLAENRNSEERPFAFLATYAHQISKDGKAKHLPLGRALEEYSGAKNKNLLLRLLFPIHKASQESEFLKEVVKSGAIYHPQAWTPQETYKFLKDILLFEKSGIVVRVPNWWKPKNPTAPQISVKIGEKKTGGIGINALLDFSANLVLGESEISEKDVQELLSRCENLVFFKGQWVAVDQEKLSDLLSKWKQIRKTVKEEGLTFGEGLRWLSGVEGGSDKVHSSEFENGSNITRVQAGEWLKETLDNLRSPKADRQLQKSLSAHLKAHLRPYQSQGVSWLYTLNQMQMGAVLADDMGLGKTIQIISLLLIKKHFDISHSRQKSWAQTLLVVPASLIGNWKAELERFAPSLKLWIAHTTGNGINKPSESDFDLVITTYGSIVRYEWISTQSWGLVIADEAQSIKNPSAKQTKAIKNIKSPHKIALTGTPVENNLSDLWSLFDFVSPGLLGSAKAFDSFMKSRKDKNNPYGSLRNLVKPYILRRLKTDKNVISDLPEKTEVKSFCQLTKSQVALYQKSVESLSQEIVNLDGIKRRGVVLSYLMRFKQICNHPAQFVKTGEFSPNQSGKFHKLKDICEVISSKQEKVLIFTQFKEMTEPLSQFLESIFERPGLILHGETPVKKRAEMVNDFQKESGPPFFVLSLKAGGTGLNLTHASHVIHFDRWWNPAVENQATDRAFRIGQKKNVLVHKFICQGTLEDKIDALIESKRQLSQEILEGTSETLLTELSNDELIKIVSLDIASASDD